MKRLISIILLLFAYQYCYAGDDSFNETRVKQLARKGVEGYNVKYLNGDKKSHRRVISKTDNLGIKTNKRRGYTHTGSVVVIENYKKGSVIKSAGKRLKSLFTPGSSNYDRNLGIISNCKNKGKVYNKVIVKDSNIDFNVLGGRVNLGVDMKNCGNKVKGINIDNNVDIKNSNIGGLVGAISE